ncbi:MAG: lipoprotein insertase outer membrane protein LolB [Wenzhouxiangella sp.]
MLGKLRLLALLGLCLLLAGCAVRDIRPEGAWLAERDAWFQAHPYWEVSGRIALSDGERGGQLAFDWRAEGEQHEVQLRTVATGKRWRLLFNEWGAVLEGSDIGLMRGPDPDFLVEQAVGWPIPVRELVFWLRGLNGAPAEQILFAADGTVASISAPPWQLEYQRFGQPQRGPLMPTRIQASSPPHQVRLVMRDWRWPDPGS